MEEISEVTTFSNGARLVAQQGDCAAAYIGVFIGTGSRDDASHPGIAHFLEHTLFKGTSKRSASRISERMEAVGGSINAYTSKEGTMLYTISPAGNEERAFELLADMVINSRFPEHEIEMEREVICEEILSYQNDPSDRVFDEFGEEIYAGTGLAHNILGDESSVKAITSGDALEFLHSQYTPSNIVIYCMSPNDRRRNIHLAEKHFGHFIRTPRPPRIAETCSREPFDLVRDYKGRQANTVMGTRLFSRHDPLHPAATLYNHYLGGGMTSRLYREMRERRGLVYTVFSGIQLYSDMGTIEIFFGTDAAKVEKCRRIISREIDRMAQSTITQRQLDDIRRRYMGILTMAHDKWNGRASAPAKETLIYGRPLGIEYFKERIEEVTPDMMCQVAELVAATPLSRLTLL